MFTPQELEIWLQRSIRLFPSLDQWMKIWQDAKGTALRHLDDTQYQALLHYLRSYYLHHRRDAVAPGSTR